jgi:hypothetical protein
LTADSCAIALETKDLVGNISMDQFINRRISHFQWANLKDATFRISVILSRSLLTVSLWIGEKIITKFIYVFGNIHRLSMYAQTISGFLDSI